MALLPCGHHAPASQIRLCEHLLGAAQSDATETAHYRFLRGVRMDYDLCCRNCGDHVRGGENIALFEACETCLAVFSDPDYFHWLGAPGIEERLVVFDQHLETRQFPAALANAKALTPLADGRVLALIGDEMQIFDEEGARVVARVVLPDEREPNWSNRRLTPRLLVSGNSRLAALINDYGRYGVVVDIEQQRVSMSLDRGDYHPEQTPFPVAFFEFGGRTLLVHGTDWNRLDVSDPRTGELISVRPSPTYKSGEERPAHYLDYFHGRLHVSPDDQWMLDDGWVWHPVGVPTWWNLSKWMSENVWESEDGESRRAPIYGDYWNIPMTWLDGRRLAIAGLGSDDDNAPLAGARIFQVENGEEISAFAGPDGAFFGDGTRLYSVGSDGLEIWDVEAGARLGRIADFRPNFQIEGALVEISGSSWRRWNSSESF